MVERSSLQEVLISITQRLWLNGSMISRRVGVIHDTWWMVPMVGRSISSHKTRG